MRKLLTLVGVLSVLAGCASDIMRGYVGKSITEPILDYGPPTNVLDLPDGRRAFQWSRTNSGILPMTTYNTSTIYAPGGLTRVTGSSTSYVPYSNTCSYTLFAKPQGSDWIIVGFRQPSLDCE